MPAILTPAPVAPAGAAWETTLTPVILLPGIGMLIVGIGFLIFAWRSRLGLKYVVLGSGAWIISVALKFAWAIHLNPGLYTTFLSHLPGTVGLAVFEVYVGLLTGVFEVALVWLVLSRTRLGQASWSQALAFGVGFGAIEAILLGLQSLASGLTALLSPDQLTEAALAADLLANNPLYGLAIVVERLAIVWVHIFCSVLIFNAVAGNSRRWVLLAFAFKTALDTVAAFAQFWGVETLGKLWTIEAIVILFGIIGWWGTRQLAERYPAQVRPSLVQTEPVPFA